MTALLLPRADCIRPQAAPILLPQADWIRNQSVCGEEFAHSLEVKSQLEYQRKSRSEEQPVVAIDFDHTIAEDTGDNPEETHNESAPK